MCRIITMKGPVTITHLRNGMVRIECARPRRGPKRAELPRSPFEGLQGRPRLHIRADEFMRLINSAPASFGAL